MQKKNILKKNWEFQEIIKTKKQIVSDSLVFYYRKNNIRLRVGISVSKKFANAVMRNKYKRQLRNALDFINAWDKKYDLIIILRKSFLPLKFDVKILKLKKMLERL